MDLTRDQKISRQQSELLSLKTLQKREANDSSLIEYVPANRNSEFQVKKRESERYIFVHTNIRMVAQDQKSIVNLKAIVKIHKNSFEQMIKEGAFEQYDDLEVIHDPRPNITGYNLKPRNLESKDEGGSVRGQISAIEKERKVLEQEKIRINKTIETVNQRVESVNTLESQLKDKEAALSEAESKLAEKQKEVEEKQQKLDELLKKTEAALSQANGNQEPAAQK